MRLSISPGALRVASLLALSAGVSLGLDGRQTVDWTWEMTAARAADGFAAGAGTPAAQARAAPAFGPGELGGGLALNASADALTVAHRVDALAAPLPEEELTLAAWVAVERTSRWGGIISCVQDNGGAERGFLLGLEDDRFSFALATEGADDGDGHLTYLRSEATIELGRWHHVAGTYDGRVMRLYVDGKLSATSKEQSGAILVDGAAPLVLGAYRDSNEDHPLDGRLASAFIGGEVSGPGTIQRAFKEREALTKLEPWTDMPFGFLVEPFLTWPTRTSVHLNFETTEPASALVTCWRAKDSGRTLSLPLASVEPALLHPMKLGGLEPDTKYFYRVQITARDGESITTEVASFRTAASPGRPFTFVVLSDSQTQGDVAKRVSDLAFGHRPNLMVHGGDLVDTGGSKRDWTDTFFPSMQPLLAHVPMMPVLGNHEQDARLYYDYMQLPEPERWYSFTYGDAEFFMIDGNRSLADQSAQLRWLEGALSASKARWRFAVLHQPPYTSDSDDYGDTTKEGSTRGDMNVRNIVGLLEEHGVDICFSGHVHDYERTFPIAGGEVVPHGDGGVVYVTAAGAGGSLEDFDRSNTWFGHKKARVHHLVYVAIHGDHLELQAIDQEGRLFDLMTLRDR